MFKVFKHLQISSLKSYNSPTILISRPQSPYIPSRKTQFKINVSVKDVLMYVCFVHPAVVKCIWSQIKCFNFPKVFFFKQDHSQIKLLLEILCKVK